MAHVEPNRAGLLEKLFVPTLSEAHSRTLVADAGVLVSSWASAETAQQAAQAAQTLGFPVAVKLCGDAIAHKTERGLVRLKLTDAASVEAAAAELLAAALPEDGPVNLLISPMVTGNRELIAGLVRDDQFGACVMVGVGGVLAEAIGDVAFRLAPLSPLDAQELIDDLASQTLLGAFRGEPAVDRSTLVSILCALSTLAQDPNIVSVDLNPLIVTDGQPVAVDALVEVAEAQS